MTKSSIVYLYLYLYSYSLQLKRIVKFNLIEIGNKKYVFYLQLLITLCYYLVRLILMQFLKDKFGTVSNLLIGYYYG